MNVPDRWRRLRDRAPMSVALLGVAAVWILGCVWSFTEQQASATAKGFTDGALLPLVLDGLAASMAGVAYAASLDGRPAVGARIGTALAVAASAASNGEWAWTRSGGNPATVALAVGIPVAANLAFEVLLGELRRQVQRSRGLPAPVAVPMPRVVRLVLAPWNTFVGWRRHVLELTAPTDAPAGRDVPVAAPAVPAAYPVHVPASAPVDPPTVVLPPLWAMLEQLTPADVLAEPDTTGAVEETAGTISWARRYAWLIDAVKAWDADPAEKRATVRAVRAKHGVGTDVAGWALREARS